MNLLRKAVTLALGEGAARAFGVVIYVAIARILGVKDFGVFSFAMGAALLAAVAIDMGQNTHVGRTVSLLGSDYAHVYVRMTLNKILTGLVLTAMAFGVMTLMNLPAQTIRATALMIGWSTALAAVEGMRALMRSLDRMAVDSVINGLESAGRLTAVLIAAMLHADVVGFSAAFLAEAVVAAILVIAYFSRRIRLVPTAEEWASTSGFAKAALGLGLVGIASAGFYRIDQVFVLPLAGETASGLYGAAARVAFTATVVAGLVTQAAYPGLAGASKDHREFRTRFTRTLALALSLAALVAVLIAALAQPVVVLLYGRGYGDAVLLMRVLSGVVLFNAVTVVSMFAANALHRERSVLPRLLVLVVATVAANVLLIPRYGALACAWISVAGEAILATSTLWLVRDKLAPGISERTER